ncbi:hypothetical protein ANN_01019 [Periplaneta americana]|uniref:Uncharacterized protein n=1 Tax=Periplaneta americana TaxID=6978 RepID=A0ABQ8TU40_PERAM|nr:hypothetical protein ANN_01019 [Periplaneta americana]
MGVDLYVYRSRIGMFSIRRVKEERRWESGKKKELKWAIGAVIVMILIMGGIEVNPGPKSVKNEEMRELIKEEMKLGFIKINQEIKLQVQDFSQTITNLKTNMENNNKRIEELQQLNSQLEKKISDLENSQRKKNLLILGINEDEREYGEETYTAVRRVCWELSEVDIDGHIEEVYRVRKGKFRPILLKFQNLRTKEMIMNRVKNARGTKLRFVNDLSYEVRRRRKLLLPYLKTARSKGHFAIMIDDKLKINDKVYILEYCEKNCDKPEFWTEIEQSQVNQGAVKRRFNERENMQDEVILKGMLQELSDICEQYEIKNECNKMKTMVIGRKLKKLNVRIRNETGEQLDSFKYLNVL